MDREGKHLVLQLLLSFSLSVSCFFDLDEINKLRYGVEITNKPVLFAKSDAGDVLHVSSKFGQLYQCAMPVRKVKEEQIGEKEKEVLSNTQIIDVLDLALKDKCFYYVKGWWTYKFCYKKQLEQYHQSGSGDIEGDIISLGSFNTETNWTGRAKKKEKDVLYHQQEYLNGSTCDLTGKPRHSVVKFYCDEDASLAKVSRLDEPESCQYELKVHTDALCHLPSFRPVKKKTQKEITCSPALEEQQYKDYLKKEEERKQKEKEDRKREFEASLLKGSSVNVDSLSALGKIFSMVAEQSEKRYSAKEKTAAQQKEENDAKPENSDSKADKDTPQTIEEAIKATMSVFGLKTNNMKIVSINKDGDKVKVEGKKSSNMKRDPDEGARAVNNIRDAESEEEARDKKNDKSHVKSYLKKLEEALNSQRSSNENTKQSVKSNRLESDVVTYSNGDEEGNEDFKMFLKGIGLNKEQAQEGSVELESDNLSGKPGLKVARDSDADSLGENPYSEEEGTGSNDVNMKGRNKKNAKFVGNIRDFLEKAKRDTSQAIKRDIELRKELSRRYEMGKERINQDLRNLKEFIEFVKATQGKGGNSKQDRVVADLVNEMQQRLTAYRRKLRAMEKTMQAVQALTKKSNEKLKRLTQTQMKHNNDVSEEYPLDKLGSLRERIRNFMEEDTEPSASKKEAKPLSDEEETKEGASTPRKEKREEPSREKESLSSAIRRIKKILKEQNMREKNSPLDTKTTNDVDETKSAEDDFDLNSKKETDNHVKLRIRRLTKEAMDRLAGEDEEDSTDNDDLKDEKSDDGDLKGRLQLKKAKKVMEDMIKEQLKETGIGINGNFKVKIITDPSYFDKGTEDDTDVHMLNGNEANQLKQLLGGILGGHHEKAQEEKRRKTLENNYNFVWGGSTQSSNADDSNRDEDEPSESFFNF